MLPLTQEIALTLDQAQAVAKTAAEARGPVAVGFCTDHAAGPGLYVWKLPNPEQSRDYAGTPTPLFAPELGHPRDFAVERLGMRDPDGYVAHPDMEGIGDNEEPMHPTLRALGFESHFVSMGGDVPRAVMDRYYEDSAGCLEWSPTRPEGADWLLAMIYDTEDGPQALFVRKVNAP